MELVRFGLPFAGLFRGKQHGIVPSVLSTADVELSSRLPRASLITDCNELVSAMRRFGPTALHFIDKTTFRAGAGTLNFELYLGQKQNEG